MKLKLQTLTNVPASKPIIAYKKLDRNLRSPIWNFQYTEGKDHKNINFNPDPKQQETNRFYSIAPPKIKEVHYPFGVRLFKVAIWGRVIAETDAIIGSEYIKLLEEIPLKKYIPYMNSMEAYCYCVTVSDKAEVRERIIEDKWIHNYCVLVKNRPNMATRIKNPDIKVWYKKDTEKGDINERFKAEDVTDPEPSPNKNVRTNVLSKVENLQTNLSPRRTVCPSIVPSLSKGRNKILVRKEKLPRSSH